MTAEIVNLNKFRKAKERAEEDRTAAENREKFGRSKVERIKDGEEQQRRDKLLDGSKLAPETETPDNADDALDPGNVS